MLQKDAAKRINRQIKDWKETFANHYLTKHLYPKYIEFSRFNSRENYPTKPSAEDFPSTSKKTHRWQTPTAVSDHWPAPHPHAQADAEVATTLLVITTQPTNRRFSPTEQTAQGFLQQCRCLGHVNSIFLITQWINISKWAMNGTRKDPFKVQDKPMNFNVIE